MAPADSFQPPWWFSGAHAQTVGARMLRPKGIVPLRRERWTTPDDDFLDLDFVDGPDLCEDVLVLILHGLEGSSKSGYAYQLYRQLADRGLPSVGLNFRSCSGELNRGRRLYHSGETSDPAWVIERLGEKFPGRALAAVGISLGGNVLLKYLGETGADSGLQAAAAWSVPFDLAAGADFMESGMARLYVTRLVRSLKAKLRIRAAELGDAVDLDLALRSKTFREFDNSATAPLHGFENADDYYRQSSSKRFLHAVRTPTLVIHSRDDPFLPASAVPEAELAANPAISAVITDRGGHVGFVTRNGLLRPQFWAEQRISLWLGERFSLFRGP